MSYQLTANGVVRIADGASIPADPGNTDYQAYLTWVAAGNTATAAHVPDLATAKATAVAQVNQEADVERATHLDPRAGWVELQRWAEAEAADAEGSPWAAGYPLLEEEVPTTGADVGAVATAVLAEKASILADLGLIEGERRSVLAAIAAATTNAEVDTALAGTSWPMGL